jgi:8-hydroxy-5-deazaflavin:NADPH oxidoreductase
VTNAYGVPPEELGGQPSSKFVAQAFTGAKLVKGFNHLVAAVLDQDPAVKGGRRVVFLASDDEDAAAQIGTLAENLGFSPIKLGGLSEGGLLVQARGNSWGRLIFKDLSSSTDEHDVSTGRATMHGSDRARSDPCEMEKFP